MRTIINIINLKGYLTVIICFFTRVCSVVILSVVNSSLCYQYLNVGLLIFITSTSVLNTPFISDCGLDPWLIRPITTFSISLSPLTYYVYVGLQVAYRSTQPQISVCLLLLLSFINSIFFVIVIKLY